MTPTAAENAPNTTHATRTAMIMTTAPATPATQVVEAMIRAIQNVAATPAIRIAAVIPANADGEMTPVMPMAAATTPVISLAGITIHAPAIPRAAMCPTTTVATTQATSPMACTRSTRPTQRLGGQTTISSGAKTLATPPYTTTSGTSTKRPAPAP